MKNFLKFTVIFFGILIILLFSVTIVTIIGKYQNNDEKKISFLKLEPKIEEYFIIKDFSLNENRINLHLENKNNNNQIIRSYNSKNGLLTSEIILK